MNLIELLLSLKDRERLSIARDEANLAIRIHFETPSSTCQHHGEIALLDRDLVFSVPYEERIVTEITDLIARIRAEPAHKECEDRIA